MRMLTPSAAVAVGLLLGTVASPRLAAQTFGAGLPADGACFYQDANFRGAFFCVPAGGDAAAMPEGMNDAISSIRVIGRAQVTVYQDSGFRGVTARFDDDVRDLRAEGWNDMISSVRVQPADRFRGRFGEQAVPREGACFFTDADFRGNRFCLTGGETAAAMPAGFNDAISSIQLIGGASVTIFQDASFSGQAFQVSTSIRDLAGVRSPNGFPWNDAISSVRVESNGFNPGDRFGFGGGQQQVPRRGACFFTDAGFQGNRFCVASGDSAASMPPGFNDEISSIQLFGGATVIIFEHDNFGGQSIRIVGPVRDLQDARSPNGFRWNDAVSSLRVF